MALSHPQDTGQRRGVGKPDTIEDSGGFLLILLSRCKVSTDPQGFNSWLISSITRTYLSNTIRKAQELGSSIHTLSGLLTLEHSGHSSLYILS